MRAPTLLGLALAFFIGGGLDSFAVGQAVEPEDTEQFKEADQIEVEEQPDPDDLQQEWTIIRMYDDDGDGTLSYHELRVGTSYWFDRRDSSLDGSLDMDEFKLHYWRIPDVWNEDRLHTMDTNLDNKVSRQEDFADAEALFTCLDEDRNFHVTKDEHEWNADRCHRERMAYRPDRDPRNRRASKPLVLAFDTNGDSFLSPSESARLIDTEFLRRDVNRDGVVTFAEYATTAGAGTTPQRAASYFRRLDATKDRKLTMEELQQESKQRFDRYDLNKDGLIDATETLILDQAVRHGQFGLMPHGLAAQRTRP